MALHIDSVMEVICAVFSMIAVSVFIMAIACLWRRGIKLEKNLKVVLMI